MTIFNLIASTTTSHPDRIGLLFLGAALALAGLVLAKALTSWWDLSKTWKALRFIGVFISAIGFFFVIFAATESPPTSSELEWLKRYDVGLAAAKKTGKPMMVDFRADWCKACDELDAEVFNDPEIAPLLIRDLVLVKVDQDKAIKVNEDAFTRFKFNGLPAVAFVSPEGEFLTASFEGKIPKKEFLTRFAAAKSGQTVESQFDIEKILQEKGLLAGILLAFLAGLFASLTPCVYPLIPITIGLFGAQNTTSKFQGFKRASIYVLGIAVTYTILGVTAAWFGSVFGGAMQSPWVLSAIALLFVVLGASSIGLFEVRVPAFIQTKLSQTKGSGAKKAFVMGLVAGIIAAPCVGPIVAGILLYVAQTQDPVLGALLLFSFSIGMGQLFLVLGTFSSMINNLPKSGGWLDASKVIFGAVFWGVAIYYLRLLIPSIIETTNNIWRVVG